MAEFMTLGKKIVGVGGNYRSYLTSTGLPIPEKPTIFLKPTSTYITEGQNIQIPSDHQINQEVELGIVIGKRCKNVTESEAMDYVGGYCLALDMTDFTLVSEFIPKGLPWSLSKSFDTATPVSKFIPVDKIPKPGNVEVWSKVNGELKQKENTSDMVFSVPHLVSYVSQFMTLEPSDVIITGTPAGLCAVRPGDVIEAGLTGVVQMKYNVTAA